MILIDLGLSNTLIHGSETHILPCGQ